MDTIDKAISRLEKEQAPEKLRSAVMGLIKQESDKPKSLSLLSWLNIFKFALPAFLILLRN